MTLSDYSQLKQKIIMSIGASDRHMHLLNQLKHIFESRINSVRRFEQIRTIGQLLKVLELRDVLSEDQVGPLRDIADKLQNSTELLKKIVDYESSHVPRKYVNCYATKPIQNKLNESNEHIVNNYVSTDPLSTIMSPRKKERIMKTVVEEIGSHWKDLCRNLKIREGIIDDIDNTNKTLLSKATKAIEVFEEDVDRQRWFFILCEALEKSRRKDIVKSLQYIITMNI